MSEAVEAEAWIGEFRAPRNPHQEVKGSIHDDATASKLGFKGGTVAGSIHMDQFVPRLLEVYGERWWRDGTLSLYFTQATTDGEKVRVAVDSSGPQAKLRMYNEAGDQICEGTAAVGPDPESELSKRILKQPEADPASLRVLKALRVGDEAQGVPMRVSREALDETLRVITETVPAYREGVLPPSNAIRLSHQARSAVLAKAAQPSVGLFGALEVQHLAGPLKADVDYVARTKVLRLGESPKTENVWYDVTVADAAGTDVARVRYLIRIMKGSSPLYA